MTWHIDFPTEVAMFVRGWIPGDLVRALIRWVVDILVVFHLFPLESQVGLALAGIYENCA